MNNYKLANDGYDMWRDVFRSFAPPSSEVHKDDQAKVNEIGEISGGRGDMPLETSEGFEYPEDIISNLTFNNYAFNRSESPEVSVDDWAAIFGPSTKAMEQRYQREFNEWQK